MITEEKKLGTIYNEYNTNDLKVNPLYQDVRLLVTKNIDDSDNDIKLNELSDKIREELLYKWNELNQPLGGGKKTDDQIIKDFKSLTTLDINTILNFDKSGENKNVLKYFGKAPSGINQYFPEMLDTPIALGNKSISVMDVIKNPEPFRKFFKSIVYNDRMYSFTMWYGWDNKYGEFVGRSIDEIIPEQTWKYLGGKDGKIANYYCSDSKKEDNKKYDGYKLPFYLQFEDKYYRLLMDEYKAAEILWRKNPTTKHPQIFYTECDVKQYIQNMRIFPNITQSFRLGGGSQPVSNFSAGIARFLILNFFMENINLIENDTFVVLDTSTGWAGRLVGLLSSYTIMRKIYKEKNDKELNVVYLTTDPNEKIKDRYNIIIDDWFDKIESQEIDRSYFKFCKFLYGSETVEFLENCKVILKEFNVKGCTMGLTSPPYFNREQYNKSDGQDNLNQSWLKFNLYKDWSEKFLKPTISNISQLMIEGGIFYMNIADLSGGKFTLEQDTIDYSNEVGLKASKNDEDVFKMLMSTMTGVNQNLDTGAKPMNSVLINDGTEKGKFQKYEPIFKLKKLKKSDDYLEGWD
jgi:hypothetical protein